MTSLHHVYVDIKIRASLFALTNYMQRDIRYRLSYIHNLCMRYVETEKDLDIKCRTWPPAA